MTIVVNGKPCTFSNISTLADLLDHLNLDRTYIAVAIDQTFLPPESYESAHLTDGQAVEIVTPMQGG